MRGGASNGAVLGREDIQDVCMAVLWCSLRRLVDGVCEQRELVEKLLDGRGDGEEAFAGAGAAGGSGNIASAGARHASHASWWRR